MEVFYLIIFLICIIVSTVFFMLFIGAIIWKLIYASIVFIILSILFLRLGLKLKNKKKTKIIIPVTAGTKDDEYYFETPTEILEEMKLNYERSEIPNLIRILNDYVRIVKTSKTEIQLNPG